MKLDWVKKHPNATFDVLGFIPAFLSDADPRPAKEQFDTNYRHGGGWRPFQGFTMRTDGCLTFYGDPPLFPLFETKLREETIRLYAHAWVAIIQPDNTFEISLLD